uniref:NifS-like protein n=1 Tax=Mimivirus LCMiAC01 TaxID=2506608 RepID=A0A481Z0T9_9VIRU|nr:MAG: aminotransferase class-V [Mimivirus LCMiAC01]
MINIYYLTGNVAKKKLTGEDIYYFDNNSTTLIYDDDVKNGIMEWISCGNPSNTLHDLGVNARNKINQCRHMIARDLQIYPSELYFTSGATESNNVVIQGVIKYYLEKNKPFTAITSSFEHPSVLNIFRYYDKFPNVNVMYVSPCIDQNDPDYGRIKPSDVEKTIKKSNNVVLISIMHANNETGAIQDVRKIGQIAKKHNIFFHSDITQSFGKFIIHPKKCNLSSVCFSGHKFHGPKGVGGLYINEEYSDILNLCYGGAQEYHKRPGTENVANIVGMSVALKKVHKDRKNKNKKLMKMKRYIIDNLSKNIEIQIIGPDSKYCLPNTIFIIIPELKMCNKDFVKKLNERGIYISVGSACHTNSKSVSHVMKSMNIDNDNIQKIIRISLSDHNTIRECEYLVKNMLDILKTTPDTGF